MTTAVVLELPEKGAFSPTKFGCRGGSFIKTKLPGEGSFSWVFNGKFYDLGDKDQIKAFNQACKDIVPHCHRRKMRCVPRVIILPEVEKVATPAPVVITRSQESYGEPELVTSEVATPSFAPEPELEPAPVAKKKRAKKKSAKQVDLPAIPLTTPPTE